MALVTMLRTRIAGGIRYEKTQSYEVPDPIARRWCSRRIAKMADGSKPPNLKSFKELSTKTVEVVPEPEVEVAAEVEAQVEVAETEVEVEASVEACICAEGLSNKKLRTICEEKDLPTYGSKDTLLERLGCKC